MLGFEAADPTGYGRLLLDETGALAAIREDSDASSAERAVTTVQFRRHGVSRWVRPVRCSTGSAMRMRKANII